MPKLTFPLRNQKLSESNSIGHLNGYLILHPVGEGHLFPVFVALDPSDNRLVVIKIMDPTESAFINEAEVFKLKAHNRIVCCKSLIEGGKFIVEDKYLTLKDRVRLAGSKTSPEPSYLLKNALVLELAPFGDLFNYVLFGPLSAGVTRFYMEQLLDAIEHLHVNGYCHSDIKLENILLDENFNIKLTDFGYSNSIFDGKVIDKKTGTPSYRPPEMWIDDFKGHNGVKTDIFQLGIVLFILLSGMPPFHEANPLDTYYKTALAGRWDLFWMLKQRDFKTKKVPGFSDELKVLLTQMLSPKLEERPSLEEIRTSSWFANTKPATEEEVSIEMKRRVEMQA